VTRTLLGILCAAATAALGALILGEYQFEGTLALIGGPLFGLVVGEVLVSAGRSRSVAVAAVGAALSFGALVWAGWISSGDGLEPIRRGIWIAAVLAALAAFVRTADLRRVATDGAG
jgi:hypothetical protein